MAIATGDPAAAVGGGQASGGSLTQRYYRRFTPIERVLHACLMLTFVGCALSGLPLLYSDKAWAPTLARLLGGFQGAGLIHRICAAVMIVVFVSHVTMIFYRAIAGGRLMKILWGPDSMVPQPQDIIDIYRNFLWFLGRGRRPQFDRWTYWEKFDYWAVFWGMFIIGGSGLLLWFPVFFSKVLPGWMFNIAALVHGEEALLAVGFIFTFHFFNGHLRPERFPMDTVVFTGRISEHELKAERGLQYARMAREGRLDAALAPPPTAESQWFGWVVGGTALILGIVAIILIVYAILH
jgi:thiosulfate reductase cytochrome b subunit